MHTLDTQHRFYNVGIDALSVWSLEYQTDPRRRYTQRPFLHLVYLLRMYRLVWCFAFVYSFLFNQRVHRTPR